jgi:quercetin dioxygenase-like cupin family protein
MATILVKACTENGLFSSQKILPACSLNRGLRTKQETGESCRFVKANPSPKEGFVGRMQMNVVNFRMAKDQTRRNFLRTAPLAAAISLPLTEQFLFASGTTMAGAQATTPEPIQVFTSGKLTDAMKALQAKPGNDNLFGSKALPFTIVMTTEEKKSGKEFEYHEGRDHIFQILDGTTTYELGGTPKDARNTKPGEWLAPTSAGATSLTLHKGDMLVIPRGTPHKRSTETSVTFTLISIEGSVKA